MQLHMLLQMLLEVEGLPTGWLWAAEGLLVDVLVLPVVLQRRTRAVSATPPLPAPWQPALSQLRMPCPVLTMLHWHHTQPTLAAELY